MTVAEKISRAKADIDAVYEKGKSVSYDVGYADGKQDGIAEGIEQGADVEKKRFWDAYQQNGTRTDYNSAFMGAGWNDTNFAPQYDIKPVGNNSQIFNSCGVTNLKAILERQGVTLDFSKVNYASNPFQSSQITHLPVMDVSGIDNLAYIFSYATKLVSVDKFILRNDGTQQFNANISFSYCNALEHCIFEGVIGQNNFDIRWSTKLSKASVTSIINCLSDTTSGLSITLSKNILNQQVWDHDTNVIHSAWSKGEWDALIATKPNWTINLV